MAVPRRRWTGRVRTGVLVPAGSATFAPIRAGFGACLLLSASSHTVLAHDGRPPEPHDVWTAWSWEPAILLGLALAGLAYARGTRTLWVRVGRGHGVGPGQVAAYAAGLAAVFVALVSPVDALSSALLAAHMVQHLLLILVAAPLLLIAAPLVPLLRALPGPARRALGPRWRRAAGARAGWRALSHPVAAWTLHALALWVWHLPTFYQAALASEAVHVAEHASFFGTALLFWWPVAHRGGRGRLDDGIGMFYVLAMGMQGGILGALMTFSARPWYPAYGSTTAAWGLTPLDDQRLAGLLMWVPAGLVYSLAAGLLFAAWFRADGREASFPTVRPGATVGGAPRARG